MCQTEDCIRGRVASRELGDVYKRQVVPDSKLILEIEAIRSRGRVWRYKGIAKVNGKKMADAEWAATIMDRNK